MSREQVAAYKALIRAYVDLNPYSSGVEATAKVAVAAEDAAPSFDHGSFVLGDKLSNQFVASLLFPQGLMSLTSPNVHDPVAHSETVTGG